MRLSMWILADWLEKYNPIIKIENGEQTLRSARILSGETCIERQNVYLAPARDFITDEGDKVICVQGHDILLLNTTDMDTVFNDIFDAFDYYNSWSDGLREAVRDGCSLQHVLDDSGRILQEPMIIFDAGHLVLAHSSQFGVGTVDEEWDTLITTGSNSMKILTSMKEHLHRSRFSHGVQILNLPYFSMRSLQSMLFHNDNVAGRIILLEYGGKISKGKMQLLESLGHLIEYWMEHNREKKLLREESAVFRDLLENKQVDLAATEHKLQMNGWKQEHDKILVKIQIPANFRDIKYPLLSRLERILEDCYVFEHQNCIRIIANLFYLPEEKFVEILSYELKQSSACCGISYQFRDIAKLPIYDEQCTLTLQYAGKYKGGIYFCKDYALNYMYSILRAHVSKSTVHPALEVLRENDRIRQNDLYHTLYVYLKHNCNLAETARHLSLHRNSLMYRLGKIRELTGVDTSDENAREYLFLSYKIME